MKLWLLRHGEAEPTRTLDEARCLTAYGRQQARQAAALLASRSVPLMLVSPYVRAQQTADEVCAQLDFKGQRLSVPWLTPDSEVRQVLSELDAYPQAELLLVTHQPLVGSLAGWLLHGHRQQPLAMGTASLAELDGPALAAGLMDLTRVVHQNRF
ncbi:phosphohistidine phosphatase SixA [Pseudomonas sp. 5P_3.1_Bac2]|uniref:phosphohistidine phosphatase SixA n=1 Tax=Pseudomonas sp. 5P_3.1_Bac2 TaxID=2971617 RepID=UPI0021CA28D5|nr:phosphohistidine phosphatase SixA [Pseudomonas sp. 5P_3.1_Bac2]MCU1716944.1 phosphohistidine phosphatase SixA [Pseudomonas sp. 5P_3.1_Bac2]